MVLYMTEVDEVVYTETPEYGIDSFLSDVGGTAGLILGMSFATVIGLIDIVLQHIAKVGKLWHTGDPEGTKIVTKGQQVVFH